MSGMCSPVSTLNPQTWAGSCGVRCEHLSLTSHPISARVRAETISHVCSIQCPCQVSSKRFQDAVPGIMLQVLRRFGQQLETHIMEALYQAPVGRQEASIADGGQAESIDPVNVLDLMTENPAALQRRVAAEARVQSLAAVRKVLFRLSAHAPRLIADQLPGLQMGCVVGSSRLSSPGCC